MRWSLFAIGLLALAQEPIRVSTRLIETHVVVRDKHGAVGDLTVEQFKLFDDGKPQRIAIFRVSQLPGTEAARPALPPGIFTNRYTPGTRQKRYRVLLIDTLNTETADQLYIRKEILKMLDGMEVHDPLAIYTMGDTFHVLQDFTTDAALLKKAMEGFKPEESRELYTSNTPTPPMLGRGGGIATAKQGFQDIRDAANRDRTQMTLKAFEQLAEYLTRVPGRKTMVWISNTFPARFLRTEELRWRALIAADVAIYPVHARGMAYSIVNPRDPGGPALASLRGEQDALNWVAEQTGGRAFYNRNDLDESTREALEDGEVVYTLGFYSEREKPDEKFHDLKVKVERQGVDVRSRAGYFDREAKTDGDSMALLRRAADAPVDSGDIGLVAAIAREGANFRVAVQVDFKDLLLEQDAGKWKGSTNLAFVSQAADGRTLDLANKGITFDMTDEAYRARRRDGFAIEQSIPVHPETARIRVVILDQTGSTGSVTIAANLLPQH